MKAIIFAAVTGFMLCTSAVAQSTPWPDNWTQGTMFTTSYRDGQSRAETFRYTTEVIGVKESTLTAGAWRGGIGERPANIETPVVGVRTLSFDPKTKMYGVAVQQAGRLEFTPFEPWGCLPAEAGKDCLAENFRFSVKSSRFPDWNTGTVTEARYAKEKETFVIEKSGEKLEVLRFILKVRTNVGRYERNVLFSPKLPFPVHAESWYDGGPMRFFESVVEYKVK